MPLPREIAQHPVPRAIPVARFVSEREIAAVMRASDPFGVDDPCPFAPDGRHYGIGSCGEVACCYCAKIFWK